MRFREEIESLPLGVGPGSGSIESEIQPHESIAAGHPEDIPLGREGTVDEVAACVVFLASDEASYVTGANLNLSGGLFLDR